MNRVGEGGGKYVRDDGEREGGEKGANTVEGDVYSQGVREETTSKESGRRRWIVTMKKVRGKGEGKDN